MKLRSVSDAVSGGSFVLAILRINVLRFACHLARIANSGRNTEFGKDICLKQYPDTYNDKQYNGFFHGFPFRVSSNTGSFGVKTSICC